MQSGTVFNNLVAFPFIFYKILKKYKNNVTFWVLSVILHIEEKEGYANA